MYQKNDGEGFTINVNIVLFDDFDTLEAFGPAEVFGSLPNHFHPRYLSVSGDVINSAQGAKIWTDFLVPDEIDDILIIPGGRGARRLLWKDERALQLMKRAAASAEYCLMIGNGSALLAQTGILYRRRIADVPTEANWNNMFTAGIERITEVPMVVDGKFYSCRTAMDGIDLSLWAIADILDIGLAEEAARRMVYDWDQDTGKLIN